MAEQVTCIKKRGDHFDAHERISAIGGTNSDGTPWSITEDAAIKAIEGQKEEFFVSVNRKKVDIIVETYKGRKYLKTIADGYSPNNLLSLDNCP